MKRAVVIGSGPNGLSAAIVLARAGIPTAVFEAESEPGGGARTLSLTLPGFLHDFGSAVHPMAAGSPFFRSLPLENCGLKWIHGDAPLAHPLDDGSAVMLERDLGAAARELGADGQTWLRLLSPLVDHWDEFAQDALGPLLRIPAHPLRMARFGVSAAQPAQWLAHLFRSPRTRALFAGLAAHSFLSFDQPFSSAIGVVLGAAAHSVGWPAPRGGAGSITRALIAHFNSLGGSVHVSTRVDQKLFRKFDGEDAAIFFDTDPGQMLAMAAHRFTSGYRRALRRFQHGPAAFKIDYALSEPVPWRAAGCRRAITVHLGGGFEQIAASEKAVFAGRIAVQPFVLAVQPTLFDPSRAPEGKHVLWAYGHVPNGCDLDVTAYIEAQIERFAPGFCECVLARRVSAPADLESMDGNLVGGDIGGGAMTARQILLRPTWRGYATSARNLFLCSSSTPPGGGVHGMCGYHAAEMALSRLP